MRKTFIMAIFTILLLLVGGAGVLYYYMNVKEYDVADEKVEEITKEDYQIDLPDLDGAATSEDGSSSEGAAGVTIAEDGSSSDTEADTDQKGTVGDSGADSNLFVASGSNYSKNTASTKNNDRGNDSKSIAGTNSANKTDDKYKDGNSDSKVSDKPAITAETIKAAYRPAFESLQAQANAKIDALVNTAFGEYQAKKQSGESVSVTYFYRKYTSAGKELESNTDVTFTYIYGSLVKDLEERGFSSSEANEFKTQYENAKSARESALIEKAKSAL